MAVERYESLNGAEKAAILMLSVGEDSAAKLFSMLDLEEVMDISQTMSLLGRVDADIVERLLREFGDRLSTPAASSADLRPPRSSCSASSTRSGSRTSWRRSGAPPAGQSGTSSATSTRRS